MRITPQIICDILKKCMSLSDDQIWIYNQRRSIPEDKRLYVVVGIIGIKPYANNNIIESTADGLQDNLYQLVQEMISIDLISYTTEAMERYSEVLGSLRGTYSQQQQELLGLKIAEIPQSVNDISAVEGAALIYRVNVTLPVLRKYGMLLTAPHYDTMGVEIYDEIKGKIGEIEQ